MDARALACLWFLLFPVLSVIKPTLSMKQKDNFKRGKSRDSGSIYAQAMVTDKSRIYRQADLETITSVEPVVVTEDNLFEQNDSTEKYNTLETTESIDNTIKTVIPLTSTESKYSPKITDITVTDGIETIVAFASTGKYENIEETKNDTIIEVKHQSSDNKNDEYIDTFNLNISSETVPPSAQGLNLTETNITGEHKKQLKIVGISRTANGVDITMRLQQSKPESEMLLKESIHNMLDNSVLRTETEDYLIQLNQRFEDLPLVDEDNSIWRKYSRAVAESFVLDFCRNYPHYTTTNQSLAHWYKDEEYNRVYNTTLHNLEQKKEHTALQFAAPVRRVADIYKAILDTPIGIVQSKCTADMPRWLCFAEYVVRLADTSETCEHVWYHAQVHLTVLQSIRNAKGAYDPATEVITELDSRLSSQETENDVNYLFDFIVQTLSDLGERLKEPLLTQTSLYNLVRILQSEDKLNCWGIDDQGI